MRIIALPCPYRGMDDFQTHLQTRSATPETPIAEHLCASIHRICRLGCFRHQSQRCRHVLVYHGKSAHRIANSGRISSAPKHGTCSSFWDCSPSRSLSIRSRFSGGFRCRHNTGPPGPLSWRIIVGPQAPSLTESDHRAGSSWLWFNYFMSSLLYDAKPLRIKSSACCSEMVGETSRL